MINNAIEPEWISDAGEHEEQALRAKMVNEGVSYLGTAGDNEAGFVEDSDWKQVCAEKDDIMSINHENNTLIFPEAIACLALFDALLLILDITFAVN